MGFGDELLGSGLARGAAGRGKRIAFGDGKRIIWSREAQEVFRGNPNVAPPGSEGDGDLEWIAHYQGTRLYTDGRNGHRWIWRGDFRPTPGEMFFTADEREWADGQPRGFVLVEPNVKRTAPNKQWGRSRWQELATKLRHDGCRVVQFATGMRIPGVEVIVAPSFRHALAFLARARLAIVPEGGLHHGAAAVGINAVVIFGGFISPAVTGYETHTNIFTGDGLGCGRTTPCTHCRAAMDGITVGRVYAAAKERLG